MRTRKLLSLLVTAVLLISCATALAEGEGSYFPLKDQIEITFMAPDLGRDFTQRVDQDLLDMTNVKINYQLYPWDSFYEKLNIALATNDLPDVTWCNPDQYKKYVVDDVFAKVSDYLDVMPNFSAFIEKWPSIADDLRQADGSLVGMKMFNQSGQMPMGNLYRADVFEKNGLAVPTTLDALYETLKSLKALYPDSYPLTGEYINVNHLVLSTYDSDVKIFFNDAQRVYQYGPIDKREGFIKAADYLKTLYAEGLLDPEYFVTTHDSLGERMTSGRSFVTFYYIGMIDAYNEAGVLLDPDYVVKAFLPVKDAQTGNSQKVMVQYPFGSWYCVVNKNSKYAEEIYRYMDFCMGEDIINKAAFGYEGETFTLNAEGKPELMEGVTQEKLLEIGADSRSGIATPYSLLRENAFASDLSRECWDMYGAQVATIGDLNDPPVVMDDKMVSQESLDMTAVNTMVDETLAQYIRGEIELADLESILDSIESNGVYKPYVERRNALFDEIRDTWAPVTVLD